MLLYMNLIRVCIQPRTKRDTFIYYMRKIADKLSSTLCDVKVLNFLLISVNTRAGRCYTVRVYVNYASLNKFTVPVSSRNEKVIVISKSATDSDGL